MLALRLGIQMRPRVSNHILMHIGAAQQEIAWLFLSRVLFVATASRQRPGSHVSAGVAAQGSRCNARADVIF